MWGSGKSDPYVKMVYPNGVETWDWKNNNHEPVWNEMREVTMSLAEDSEITFKVYDWDINNHDELGKVSLNPTDWLDRGFEGSLELDDDHGKIWVSVQAKH